MKKSVFLAVLLVFVSTLAFSYEYENHYSEDLILIPEDDPVCKTFDQVGSYLLYEFGPFPTDYGILTEIRGVGDGINPTTVWIERPSAFNADVKFRVEFLIFEEPLLHTKYREETTLISEFFDLRDPINEYNLAELFDAPKIVQTDFQPYCIKNIIIWANVNGFSGDSIECCVENIKLNSYAIINPEYQDYYECKIYTDQYRYKPGDDVDLYLDDFYFGYPSEIVDIYFVFYDNTNIYFFPQFSTEIAFETISLPQYTMAKAGEVYFGTVNTLDLPYTLGEENSFALGIAPTGTLDFYEVSTRNIIIEN